VALGYGRWGASIAHRYSVWRGAFQWSDRRFDQHYQNMCGFDGIKTARKYLHLFELTYRFTPFAKDNRPVEGRALDIRGKCPLELAGYDVHKLPIAQVVRGQLLGWPPQTLQEIVPNA
jgi:hypothetical protein